MKILSITCLLVLMVALPIISEGKVTLKDNEKVNKEFESALSLESISPSSSNDKEDRNKFIDKMFYRVSFQYKKMFRSLGPSGLDHSFFLRWTTLWRTMNNWNNWKKCWKCSTYLCNVGLDPWVCFFEHFKAAATLKIVEIYASKIGF